MPRIEAILVETSRPEDLARFYARAFDLPEPSAAGDLHVGFDLDGVYLGFERVEEATERGRQRTSLWLHVDSVRSAFDRAIAAGAVARSHPVSEGGECYASVLDPAGNMVGLIGPGKVNEPRSMNSRT